MKVCMLAPEFLPVWGGVGTYIVELMKHMPDDIEVHVITPLRKGLGKEKVTSSSFDFSEYFRDNIHVHFVGSANDTFFYNGEFQSLCSFYVPRLVKEEKIDLIHSHTAHMPDLVLQFRRLKVPVVTTIHTTIEGQRNGTRRSGLGFSDLEFSEKITYTAYPFLRLAEDLYFMKRRHYITVSNWMKSEIIKKYPRINSEKVSVIHNSVDSSHFSPGVISDLPKNMVLFTGRLVAAKGINYLVEAIPTIVKDHPDANFVFIGAGNSIPYQKRLKQLEVSEKNYSFIGYLKSPKDLLKYYQASSVYVAPTLYENFPIRVLEAMACGTAVVASNVCAIPEAVDDGSTGLLVKPGSVDDIIRGVSKLLGDDVLRKKLGHNARSKILEKFDLNVNTAKTTQLYKNILDNPAV